LKSLGVTSVFLSVTALFFAWGFITSNNDPLIAALIASFGLSYTEALMIHLVSFAAFGLVSIPAAALLARVGAHNAIMIALSMMVAGCLLVQLVTRFERFELILTALFILAAGITVLQVAANPLAAGLGRPREVTFALPWPRRSTPSASWSERPSGRWSCWVTSRRSASPRRMTPPNESWP